MAKKHLTNPNRFLVFSDLHIGSHGVLTSDVSLRTLEAIRDSAIEYGCYGGIVFLGDLFHSSNPTDADKTKTLDVFKHWSTAFPTYLLVGNHDCYNKSGVVYSSVAPEFTNRHAIDIFHVLRDDFPHIHVIDNVTPLSRSGNYILFLPFTSDHDAIVKYVNIHKPNIIFGHFPTFGADLTKDGRKSSFGFDWKGCDLSTVDLVMLGDFHHAHTVTETPKIMYVGSPYQQSRSEAGDKKGWWILDLSDDTIQLQFIENEISPEFIVITVDSVTGTVLVNGVEQDVRAFNQSIDSSVITVRITGTVETISRWYTMYDSELIRWKSVASQVVIEEDVTGDDLVRASTLSVGGNGSIPGIRQLFTESCIDQAVLEYGTSILNEVE